MAKFMFLYRGSCENGPEKSPEEMQQMMQAWGQWMAEGTKAGWLLDPGDGLKSGGKVLRHDGTVTDGPFAESKELVGGYSLVEATDLAAAVEIAKGMPETDGHIEIRELSGHSME